MLGSLGEEAQRPDGQGRVTCFMMRRARMFMTKPPRRGYMVRDWMTVLMSSMGRGLCSMSCCITTASTSDVYTFRSAKHRLVAVRRRRVGLSSLPGCPREEPHHHSETLSPVQASEKASRP
jgi:hypothetical protein